MNGKLGHQIDKVMGEWSEKSTFQTVGLPEIDLSNTNIIFDEFIGSGDLPYSSKVQLTNTGTANLNVTEITNEIEFFDISERSFIVVAWGF